MNETSTQFDVVAALASLLTAAQGLTAGKTATAGVVRFATELTSQLNLPGLARTEEAEAAIRAALTPPGTRLSADELSTMMFALGQLSADPAFDPQTRGHAVATARLLGRADVYAITREDRP
jgi:hypothetical protein